ncbi:putative MmgE/Prp family protein [Luminiphilus syltensis NOR5-1B]|uniref:Putative MmgE/Prp family protein n=1 Tax=Luminiphilus syltensis NOR5-1B TaxID=565045 RepID=B8KTJ0_9GAMM|nr:MmgE/PrpD family protein [Luminiphilus syltensis]EED34730.1 putative MmgE/Prp family protein [Luminiphilus syltensis NOR5-1B]
MNSTGTLAEFAAGIQFKDLPPEVVDRLKLLTLNIVGKAFAGSATSLGAKYLKLGQAMGGGSSDARVIASDITLSCPAATYVNSGYATALDYDDTLHWALIHPGNAAVTSGLAVGSAHNRSGKDFLTALVLGYEVGGRIALAAQPSVERFKDVWGLGNQSFTSAPVVGRLLNLSADQMYSALGITGVYSVVPSAWTYLGPGTRPMREVKMAWGWSAMVGVTGATAASLDLTMQQELSIFDSEEGWHLMHGADKMESEKMTDGLGERWDVLTTAYKAYSACYLIFGVCDAVQVAIGDRSIGPEDVEKVVVSGGEWITKRLSDTSPVGPVDAQFSTEWCVSMIIMQIPPGPEWCSDETMANPVARALTKRVEVAFDEHADAAWLDDGKSLNSVTIVLKNGEELTGAVDEPKGEPGNPITESEVRETFHRLAAYAVDADRAAKIEQVIDRLDTLENISELTELL